MQAARTGLVDDVLQYRSADTLAQVIRWVRIDLTSP